VITGLILIFSLAREASCVSRPGTGDGISEGYPNAIPDPTAYDGQANWLLISIISLVMFTFFLWNLFKSSGRICQRDWIKIAVTTAIIVAPLIFVVALNWRGGQ
jgi:hypothetical protein